MLFKNLQEPEITDITKLPAYLGLSDTSQKKVSEVYQNVFDNNSERMGIKIAQGIAFATAKQMCESFDEIQEGDAEDFQIGNDNLVGMTEQGDSVDPESEEGAKSIQKNNWTEKCPGCGDLQPSAVLCSNCSVSSKQDDNDLLSGDILKNNHQEKGMNESVQSFENGSDEMKTYLTHHTLKSKWKTSADAQNHVTQSWGGKGGHVIKVGEGQQKAYFVAIPLDKSKAHEYSPFHAQSEEKGMGNLDSNTHNYKNPNTGKMIKTSFLEGSGFHWATNAEYNGPHGYNAKSLKQHLSSDDNNSVKEAVDSLINASAGYLTNRAKVSGILESKEEEQELITEKHIGFKNLEHKLEAQGKSPKAAGGIAAAIGDRKYGAKAMHKAAKNHTSLGEAESILTEAQEQMWNENYFPAKPLEEHCTNCSHPKSFHDGKTCLTCESICCEAKNDKPLCFCGHAFGEHKSAGCKTCKSEGLMSAGKVAHQYRPNTVAAMESEFNIEAEEMFNVQQGKINQSFANARLNWLPEDETTKTKLINKPKSKALSRKTKDQLMRDMGLTKVKGSVSGKTYYESEN